MPLDFPNTPSVNDIFTATDGRKWKWSGTVWNVVTTATLDINVAYPITTDSDPINPVIGLDQGFIDDNKILSIMGAI